MDINSVNLTGRLVRDAETKMTAGRPLTELAIAVGYATKNANGEWQSAAHFVNVKIWGKHGESLNPYLLKGQMIAISGRLEQERWEYEGKNYSKLLVVAHSITLCGGKKDEQSDTPQTLQEAREQQKDIEKNPSQDSVVDDDFDDDIPF